MRIGTGGAHGTYFPIGSLIEQAINTVFATDAPALQSPGVVAGAQLSNGSVSNVTAIEDGRLEAALVQADVAHWAYTGTVIFEGKPKHSRLRAVANLYLETVHLVARTGSGIRSVADLAGHRVSLDDVGSGTLADARIILEAFELDESDLDVVYLKPQFAATKMKQGELDAFFIVAGHPTKAVYDVAQVQEGYLVPIAGPPIAALLRQHPYFTSEVIPADVYPGVEQVTTLAIGAQLMVDAELGEQLVNDLTRTLWSERAQRMFEDGHPIGRRVRRDQALQGIALPLHPGAERYYRDVGLLLVAGSAD